jgi:hypothetical protein
MSSWKQTRDNAAMPIYEFTGQLATQDEWVRQRHCRDSVPAEFFSPDNVDQVMQAARRRVTRDRDASGARGHLAWALRQRQYTAS